MRSVGPDNPIISCEDIPQVSILAWKTEIPLLTQTETVVPMEDWLNFKTEVNDTINDILANIMSKKPPPGSLPTDWAAFRQNINNTFSDLKDKFTALHPKIITNVSLSESVTNEPNDFDWISIKNNVNDVVSDIMDSLNANKPPPGSLPADWLAYKKKINDSLIEVRKKFKVIHPKLKETLSIVENLKVNDIPTVDWDNIKSNINATINDIVSAINASKPLPNSAPAAWFAFRKKINDSLSVLEDKFKNLYVKKPYLTENKLNDKIPFDWLGFKDKLNQTLSDIIASVMAKRPPPGSSPEDWSNFEKELNATFSQFTNQFSDIHPKSIVNDDGNSDKEDFSILPEDNGTQDVNKTIMDIVAEINANKPSPGSPQEDWLTFKQKMNNTFSKVKRKYAYLYPRVTSTNVKKLYEPSSVDSSTFDAIAFKENLNKSITDLIDLIKIKKPSIDSPQIDWLAYKKEIKDSMSKLKDEISGFKTKQLLEPDYTMYIVENFDDTNKAIEELSNEIKTLIPEDDVSIANLQSYLKKSLTNLKSSISNIPKKPTQFRLMALINEDWQNFKDRTNTTIEDALDDVISNKPAKGDPAWMNYGVYIKNRFAQLKDDVNAIKTDWLVKVKSSTEMMTVMNLQTPASSASLLVVKLKYMVAIILPVVLLIN